MKTYVVNIKFFQEIFQMDVKAHSKSEAYKKAKERFARRLFKMSNLKNYSCTELW